MDKTKHRIQKLIEENKQLRYTVKEILKIMIEKPYCHKEDVFGLASQVGIHVRTKCEYYLRK